VVGKFPPGLFRVTLSAGSGALPRLPNDTIHGDTRPQAVSVPTVTDRLACRGKQHDIVAGQKRVSGAQNRQSTSRSSVIDRVRPEVIEGSQIETASLSPPTDVPVKAALLSLSCPSLMTILTR
jgi:hypothetical protein